METPIPSEQQTGQHFWQEVDRKFIERVASIMGVSSASAKALAKAAEIESKGQVAEIFRNQNKLIVIAFAPNGGPVS